jgi:hypothetical protein
MATKTVFVVFCPQYCERDTPLRVFPNEAAATEWCFDQDQAQDPTHFRATDIDHTPYSIVECVMEV